MYDIIVVGGGPAGLAASIYAARALKKTLVIEKSIFGGQITQTTKVENYPGFLEISGMELGKKMALQAKSLGVESAYGEVTKISKEQIKSEVDIINNKLKKAIGKEASIVRVPYGATNDNVKSAINYPIIMWNVDTRDWKSRNAKSVEQQVIGKVKDGDIILMHDLYESTAQACETIIPKLIEQGYQFVTIDELFEYKGIEMKNGTKYSNANKK